MAEPRFAQVQAELAGWIRDPSRPPPAGLEARRLALYRELFFNNVCDFVETAFPVLKSLLPADEWEALLQAFFRDHRPQSPYFRDISLAFRQWLEEARPAWLAERPWRRELLHFEWAGLAADCAEVEPGPAWAAGGDLLEGEPVLRAATWLLAYRWPVHRLGSHAPPAAEPPATPTFLLLWRDDEGTVHQREATPLAARLLECLQEEGGRGGDLLARLAAEAGLAGEPAAAFRREGAALLEDLQREGLIQGIRCDNRGR